MNGGQPWAMCFDGLCEPSNPSGVMAWGWFLWTNPGSDDPPRQSGRGSKPAAKENTNNVAEYLALYYGLLRSASLRRDVADYPGLIVRGDSKLVIEQIKGRWSANAPRLKVARDKCLELLERLSPWDAEWIPRQDNYEADGLSREAYKDLTGTYPPERLPRKGRVAG